MTKNIIITIIILLVLIFMGLVLLSNSAQKTSINKSHVAYKLTNLNKITCTYTQTLQARYQDGEITHELPRPETNPIIMSFSDLQTETPKIQFIDATRTISEVPIIKLVDLENKFIFLEGTGDPYITLHTVYKDSGVATYEKSISLLGIPMGTISMGFCMG